MSKRYWGHFCFLNSHFRRVLWTIFHFPIIRVSKPVNLPTPYFYPYFQEKIAPASNYTNRSLKDSQATLTKKQKNTSSIAISWVFAHSQDPSDHKTHHHNLHLLCRVTFNWPLLAGWETPPSHIRKIAEKITLDISGSSGFGGNSMVAVVPETWRFSFGSWSFSWMWKKK